MYGEAGALQEAAARCAGGWKPLFAARHAALKEAEPWLKPSSFELEASLDMLAALPPHSAAAAAATMEVKQAAAAAGQAAAAAGGAATSAAAPAEEIQAEVEAEAELCIVFLVDGSGALSVKGLGAGHCLHQAATAVCFAWPCCLPFLDCLYHN